MATNQTAIETKPKRVLKRKTTSVFDDTREITRRFGVAVKEAISDHKRAGNAVAIWRDDAVVIVQPEDIRWEGRRRETISFGEDETSDEK